MAPQPITEASKGQHCHHTCIYLQRGHGQEFSSNPPWHGATKNVSLSTHTLLQGLNLTAKC